MALISHLHLSARVTVEAFFHTFSTQMCGKRGFTRATGESEYPRQESHGEKHGEKFSGQQWATKGESLFYSL